MSLTDVALQDWGAHAFRVLVAAFRRNGLSPRLCFHVGCSLQRKVRERLETFASTPEACAPQRHRFYEGHFQNLAW